MPRILHQKEIKNINTVEWSKFFTPKEFKYLQHVINGLINSGSGYNDVSIQVDGNNKTLHVYEPFSVLNYLGYGSPSVVSIKFNADKIQFLIGDDNGIEINSSRLSALPEVKLPNNLTPEICFWHFVDAIGDSEIYEELP